MIRKNDKVEEERLIQDVVDAIEQLFKNCDEVVSKKKLGG